MSGPHAPGYWRAYHARRKADPAYLAARAAYTTAWKRRRLATETPAEREARRARRNRREKLWRYARAEALERGVPTKQVMAEWGAP